MHSVDQRCSRENQQLVQATNNKRDRCPPALELSGGNLFKTQTGKKKFLESVQRKKVEKHKHSLGRIF